MSLYFDLVINCDLREDTPPDAIEAIKCLTSRDLQLDKKPTLIAPEVGNIWDYFYDEHFLAPDTANNIISNFQRRWITSIPEENHRKVYRYRLQFSGVRLHDDYFYPHYKPFTYWLATIFKREIYGLLQRNRCGWNCSSSNCRK